MRQHFTVGQIFGNPVRLAGSLPHSSRPCSRLEIREEVEPWTALAEHGQSRSSQDLHPVAPIDPPTRRVAKRW